MDRQPYGAPISLTSLPLELFDTVIDEFHDQLATLKSCSLVSSKFVLRAQKHLFTAIRINYPYFATHNAAQDLFDVLARKPGLARYIRSLRIQEYFEGVWDDDKQEYRHITDEVLPRIFKRLRYLKVFSLIGTVTFHNMPHKMHENDLSPHLLSALFQLFRSNTVAEITLEYITNFPLGHIAMTCPHLKRLSIVTHHLSYTQDDVILDSTHSASDYDSCNYCVGLPIGSTSGVLEFLQLDDSPETARVMRQLHEYSLRPQSQLKLSDLRTLVFHGYRTDVQEALVAIVTDAASSLVEFVWDHNFDLVFFPFDPSSIDLGITTRLQSLRLSCVHHAGNQPIHLLWISQALRGIRAHNNLEELVLNLTCDQLEVTLDADWIEVEEWALEFDSLMTSPGFDHLHRVAVFVDLFDANNPYPLRLDDNARVIEGLEELLPLLQDTGLLSVQWVVNELEGCHGTLELEGILDNKQALGVHIPLNAQKSPEPVWYCAED